VSAVDPAVISYRLDQNAKAIDRLSLWRIDVDKSSVVLAEQVKANREDTQALSEQIASLKRLLVSVLVSVTSGTVLLSLSLLAATGHIG
jgi:hypothetical protein